MEASSLVCGCHRETTFVPRWLDTTRLERSELGIEGRWLKRLQEFGLGYLSKASLRHLEKLAEHFGYLNYLHLWREDLLELMGLPEPTEEKVAKWKHSPNWRRAEKLLELLDSGDFDHLATLTDDMYELGIARTSKSSEKPPVVTARMEDFVKKKRKGKAR